MSQALSVAVSLAPNVRQAIAKAQLTNSMTQKLTIQQVQSNRREAGLIARAQDVKTLCSGSPMMYWLWLAIVNDGLTWAASVI